MADPLIANPCEYDPDQTLWKVCAGTGRCVYVWGTTDLGAVEEMAIDFADEQGWCDWFEFLYESDFKDAAQSLGVQWKPHWPDWDDPDYEKVMQEAEADLSTIGHTTLKCMPKGAWGAYVPWDWYWNFAEITDTDVIEKAARRSLKECYDHDFLVGDRVVITDLTIVDPPAVEQVYRVTEVSMDDIRIEGERDADEDYVLDASFVAHYDPNMPGSTKNDEPVSPANAGAARPKTEGDRLVDFFFGKKKRRSRSRLNGLPSWDKRRRR